MDLFRVTLVVVGLTSAVGTMAAQPLEPWTIRLTSADGSVVQVPDTLPPVELPNFLTPPSPSAPRAPVLSNEPRSSVGEYNPSHVYLPDYVPPSPRRSGMPCDAGGRFWFNGSLFYGTIQNENIPTLLAAGGDGILGNPGVVGLATEDRNAGFFRPGFLFNGGYWMNNAQTWGIEGSLLLLESNKAPFDFLSIGNPVLGQSYVNALTGQPETSLIASPGRYLGHASLISSSSLIGGEANFRDNLLCSKPLRIDAIVGYRFLRLSEAIDVTSRRLTLADWEGDVAGTQLAQHDRFSTQNDFHGGQIGLSGEYRYGSLFLDAGTKIAFGLVRERLDISGNTLQVAPAAAPILSPTGLLAQASNSGTTNQSRIAVVPEVGVSMGYQFGDHLRAHVGYTFLYMSNVGRPGQAIDTTVNPSFVNGTPLVGDPRPVRRAPGDDFWMQGINVGLELRY